MHVLDCHSRSHDPDAVALSNFTERPFVLDDVHCASMEGFLQALKTPSVPQQHGIAALHGYTAFKTGQTFNNWKETQVLHWNGQVYHRDSFAYQELLDRAYDAQFDQNPEFATHLRRTVGKALRHTMGKHDTRDSVLVEAEYVSRLERLRWRALDGSKGATM